MQRKTPTLRALGLLAALACAAPAPDPAAPLDEVSEKSPSDGVWAELSFDGWARPGGRQSSHIMVDLAAEGQRPLPMTLDTGARWSLMTPRYARELGVSVRRGKRTPYRRRTVVGDDLQFYVSDTGSSSGLEVGVVGTPFLKKYSIDINWLTRRVRFLDPGKHPVPEKASREGEIVAELQMAEGKPLVEVQLGTGKALFLVDTGANLDFEISERTADQLGIARYGGWIRTGRNLTGYDRSLTMPIDSVRIGDHDVGPSTVTVTLAEGSSWRHTNQVGADEAVLGSNFLSRFRVRIDYKHRRMSLLPLTEEEQAQVRSRRTPQAAGGGGPGADDTKAHRFDTVGAVFIEARPGQFFVDSIDPEGRAAKLGLQRGDVVTNALGRQRLSAATLEARILKSQELTVARQDGNLWIDLVLPKPVYTDED